MRLLFLLIVTPIFFMWLLSVYNNHIEPITKATLMQSCEANSYEIVDFDMEYTKQDIAAAFKNKETQDRFLTNYSKKLDALSASDEISIACLKTHDTQGVRNSNNYVFLSVNHSQTNFFVADKSLYLILNAYMQSQMRLQSVTMLKKRIGRRYWLKTIQPEDDSPDPYVFSGVDDKSGYGLTVIMTSTSNPKDIKRIDLYPTSNGLYISAFDAQWIPKSFENESQDAGADEKATKTGIITIGMNSDALKKFIGDPDLIESDSDSAIESPVAKDHPNSIIWKYLVNSNQYDRYIIDNGVLIYMYDSINSSCQRRCNGMDLRFLNSIPTQ